MSVMSDTSGQSGMAVDKDDARTPLLAGDMAGETGPVKRNTKPQRLVVVEPYIILYTVAGYPADAIYTQYIYRKVGYSMGIDVDNLTSPVNSSFGDCGTDINDTNYLLREQVQAATSQWTLYIALAAFLPFIVAFVLYGTMSDRMGRRMCFILPPIGCIARALIEALAIYYEWPVWTFFFRMVEYFFGSYELMAIGAFAYIADTTAQRHLAMRIIIVDATLLATAGLSELGAGYMIRFMGYFWPMIFVVGGKLLALLYAIFLIPETVLNTEEAKPLERTDFTRALKLFTHDNGTGRRWKVNMLFASYFLSSLVDFNSILSLVEMNAPLCWDSVLIGYNSALARFLKGSGTMVGVGLKRCFAEEWIIIIAILTTVCEYLYIPFVRTTLMMFLAPALGILSQIPSSMTRTILSSYVDPSEQGALMAGFSTVYTISYNIGQLATNNIYSATILVIQGRLVFVYAAFIWVISAIIVLIFISKTKEDRKRRMEVEKRCILVISDNQVNEECQ